MNCAWLKALKNSPRNSRLLPSVRRVSFSTAMSQLLMPGPWTKIGTHDSSSQVYYLPEICPKFQTAKKVYIFTAGNWNNRDVYHLTVVPLELVV
jgi:hypothetical protein